MDNNLILYLPFDNEEGDVAYDYSQNRADGTLSGCAKITDMAKTGDALALNGSGECLTATAIPFSSDFTLTAYVQPKNNRLGWLLNFSGINNYKDQWFSVVPGEWIFIAFVKSAGVFTVYLNSQIIFSETISGTPIGLTLNDDNLTTSYAVLDDVMLYNVAKNEKEILKLQASTDVEYYIDGYNLKDFGVNVSASSGLVGQLARKDSLEVDWDNYHGVVRDKSKPRYKERTITLDCFIEASSRSAYIHWVNKFFNLFDKPGNQRLKVEFDGTAKTLLYEVFNKDESDPDKKWGTYNDDLMVGKFKIKLIEDEPVKRILRHIGSTANTTSTITVTSTKMLNIYWGDGSHTYNISGANKVVEHTYVMAGEYDIIITGVIEDIEKFETNDIIVWNRLR